MTRPAAARERPTQRTLLIARPRGPRFLPTCVAVWTAVLLPGTWGCVFIPRPSAEELARGYVWMCPGIEGTPILMKSAYEGMRDAGIDCAIEAYDWPSFLGPLDNLIDPTTARTLAQRVAPRIAKYIREHPGRPMHLLGYSAGGAICVFVAEALPEDVQVENVVLVQASISRDYDLTAALKRTRGQLVNIHVPSDLLMLGVGTTVFGTVDRKHGFSAGKDGFDLEKAVPQEALRAKVAQQAWSPKALWSGHFGNHLSLYNRHWNKEYVAMWLLRGLIEDEEPLESAPPTVAPPLHAGAEAKG